MSKVPRRVPLSLGLISEPPCLVLGYEEEHEVTSADTDTKSNGLKRRKRKIPVRNFTDKSNVVKIAQGLKLRHEEYLETVPIVVIEKMLRVIQEIIKGLEPEEAAVKVHAEYVINPNEDLNKLSVEEISRKKLIMEESFKRNQLQPSDPDYKYDKQVDFATDEKAKSGWDSSDELENENEADQDPDEGNNDESIDKIETHTKTKSDDEDDFW